jgi:hypothetical protein
LRLDEISEASIEAPTFLDIEGVPLIASRSSSAAEEEEVAEDDDEEDAGGGASRRADVEEFA